MVRVISCHHFVSQDVFLSKQEPVAFCNAQGKLMVATVQHSIQVYDLDSRGNVLHTFPTVDQVKQLIYCDIGNFVATLETKSSRHSSLVTYVRIYFKWWIDMEALPMRLRIAGSTAQSTPCWNDQFEMVELPLNETTLCITCCKKTASLAVSLGQVVSVFCYTTKEHNISKQKYHDFDHFIDINMNFVVQELSMCEGYFACMSETKIQVFKVNVEKDDNGSSGTEHLSKINSQSNDATDISEQCLDDNFIEWRFESCTVNGLADTKWEEQLKANLHPDSFPYTINLRNIEKENQTVMPPQQCERYGPILTVNGQKIEVTLDSKAFELWPTLMSTTINAVTFLYREFVFRDSKSKLLALQLMPFYKADNFSEGSVDPLHAAAVASEEYSFSLPWSPLSSTLCSQLKAVGCFFSTSQEGFLYDVTGETRMIGSYPYTAPLKYAVLEPTLLHGLTEAGLETYTIRLPHCALHLSENPDSIKNCCPSYEDPVCLLGLRPFLGVDQLIMSENHLILVSSPEDSVACSESAEGNNCTLYSLKKPSPHQMFSDLLEMGQFHKASSPTTYLHLLSEGHMILRTNLFLNRCCQSQIEELYRKSCILLADYFICNDSGADKSLAVPYYHLSQLSVEEVVQRAMGFRNQIKHSPVVKALVQYLNSVLLNEESLRRDTFSKSIAEIILDMYMEEAPELLWKVILCSGISSYKIEKAILMLKRRMTSKRHPLSPAGIAADTTALVSLLLKKDNTEAAQNMLLSLGKTELVPLIVEIHHLLWVKEGLTVLGQFTKQVRPDAFVEMLLHLIEGFKKKTSDVLSMLQKEADETAIHKIPLLKEFLETLLSDKKGLKETGSNSLNLLITIYLNRLIESRKEISSKTSVSAKTAVMFGPRLAWLNEMPPFNGKGISRSCLAFDKNNTKKDDVKENYYCPCWICNEELLRLQSLLVLHHTNAEVCDDVLNFLSSTEREIRGRLSLEVLCSKEEHAVTLLLNTCPSALLAYATETFAANEDKWCMLFSLLLEKTKVLSENDPVFTIYTQSFHGVLNHLAQTLSISSFVSLLPEGQNSTFSPHVKRCCEKHQAEQLKKKIVTLGNEIKAMM